MCATELSPNILSVYQELNSADFTVDILNEHCIYLECAQDWAIEIERIVDVVPNVKIFLTLDDGGIIICDLDHGAG